MVGRQSIIATGLLTLLLLSVGGCVRASLATNTGPRTADSQWSTGKRHMVHVGEKVDFDFVLTDSWGAFLQPLGTADYCVVYIEGERIETEADEHGHFPFSYQFDGRSPGDKLRIESTAYRQKDRRDFMLIAGEWSASESPYDLADKRVARDSITLTFYQADIELKIQSAREPLVLNTGILRMRQYDGTSRAVYLSMPGRPGFEIDGPDSEGVYLITYTPDGTALNKRGSTEVEFTIYDASGQPHSTSTVIETP